VCKHWVKSARHPLVERYRAFR